MSEHIVEGEKDKAKGRIREDTGKLTGNREEQAHGKLEQAGGEIKKKIGQTEENV